MLGNLILLTCHLERKGMIILTGESFFERHEKLKRHDDLIMILLFK